MSPAVGVALADQQGRDLARPSRDSWVRRERRAMDLARAYLSDRRDEDGPARAAAVLLAFCEVRHG